VIGSLLVPEPEASDDPTRDTPWLDTHLGVYLHDPGLWPVAIVALAIGVTLGGALLVQAVHTNRPVLWGAIGILALMSGNVLLRELRARRRLGLASRVLLLLWAASAAVAFAASAFGWV